MRKFLKSNKICFRSGSNHGSSSAYRGWGHGPRVHAGGYGPSLINFNWVHIRSSYGIARYGVRSTDHLLLGSFKELKPEAKKIKKHTSNTLALIVSQSKLGSRATAHHFPQLISEPLNLTLILKSISMIISNQI